MFKTGIYKKEQLTPEKLYGFFGRRKYVAIDLYDDYAGPAAEIDRFQEHAIGRLATANGSFKKTHANRFDDFDARALAEIRTAFPAAQGLRAHDLAISDGRTTVPFFRALADVYGEGLSFLASDYAAEFIVVRDGSRRVVTDAHGNLIQFTVPPFVFSAVKPESAVAYPLNHLLRKFWQNGLVSKILARAKDSRRILLLCRACKDLMADRRFTFETYDLLSGPAGRHHVIRAMNILNPDYFPPDQMRAAVRHIAQSLEDGGLLITGSNVERGSAVDGGVYRKSGDAFVPVWESGKGSPVRDLLTQPCAP